MHGGSVMARFAKWAEGRFESIGIDALADRWQNRFERRAETDELGLGSLELDLLLFTLADNHAHRPEHERYSLS
jgi:hypothetical protein